MTYWNEMKEVMERNSEWHKLKNKTDRTKEEQERYEYLRDTYHKPLSREDRMVYKRICSEAIAFGEAKRVDKKR